LSTFSYQSWKKQESEQRIMDALNDKDRSFSELLELTELSKPILSERLKNLEKRRKIEAVPEKATKRFLYHLCSKSLDIVEKARLRLHTHSRIILDILGGFALDPSTSDREYVDRLTKGVSALFNLRLLENTLMPASLQQEWLKTTLGVEFAKRLPKLFPKSRNVSIRSLNELSLKELSVYESKGVEEKATKILEYLDEITK
jgi:DNA-binding transcriptional ArsR family regulator